MSIAVIPGTFDPITAGHVDMIRRARAMFDEVVVIVAQNPAKEPMFSASERQEMAEIALGDLEDVRVEILDGLLAPYCQDIGANTIVKGLRGPADLETEQAMAMMNRHISGIETVFLLSNPTLGHVASSLVKEVAAYGGSIRGLVPINVEAALKGKLSNYRL